MTPSPIEQLRQSFANPPAGTAPMMRWWWFGPSVEHAELDRQLGVMAAAGIGGVEVAYVYPLTTDGCDFGSQTFLADLRHAAETAHGLGLRFDLTLGSGWSFGGPHITAALAARRLHWERRQLVAVDHLVPVEPPEPGDVLVGVYLGPGWLELPVVDGFVHVPASTGTGSRQLLLAFARLTGQNVKRAARGAEGPVLDHYSKTATSRHLEAVGDRLLGAVPTELVGSVFCDSLEVYGSDWTPNLPAEFRKRRGYDLRPRLPELLPDGPSGDGRDAVAFRSDYHRTLTELYEQNFVAVCHDWAAAYGVPFRLQGYGTPPAMISSYRGADLIEGEGWGWTELTQTRWASSAAHHVGLTVVSAEVWTWVHSPSFRATPLDLKGEAHEHLLSGVNQFIGHGWPYSPPAAPGLGWFFYAAGALDDRNPWWPAMAPLMRYLTRLCWLMRQGVAVSEVIVHVPDRELHARMGTAVGGSLDAWREASTIVGPDLVGALRRGGWDYDLVDDRAILDLPVDPTRAVVIVGARELSARTHAWCSRVLAGGGAVLTVESSVDLPGSTACTAAELPSVLATTHTPAVQLDPPTPAVGVVHRRLPGLEVYLVVNTGAHLETFRFRAGRADAVYEQWEAVTGGRIRSMAAAAGLDLVLHPYEATVVVVTEHAEQSSAGDTPTDNPATIDPGEQPGQSLDAGWEVCFPGEPFHGVTLPHVWEDDPAHRAFSGSATYRHTFEHSGGTPIAVDFGPVTPTIVGTTVEAGTRGHSYQAAIESPIGVVAEVRVNGVDCSTLWAPPYRVEVGHAARPGTNVLEFVVHNTAANALAHDEHIGPLVAAAEQRYGRRFEMQELGLAMVGVRSGLLAVPRLVGPG